MRSEVEVIFVVGLLGAAAITLSAGRASALSWSIQAVDSSGEVGKWTSIALDSNGYPHISYYDVANGNLKYARWNGVSWIVQTVDSGGDVGGWTSIAVDSRNRPHIGYLDFTNADLKYAIWTDSSWTIQTVDGGGLNGPAVGYWSSIALDGADCPHISYFDSMGIFWEDFDLKYAKWTGSAWAVETVDRTGDVGEWSSLALDDYGFAHISYYDNTNGNLKYAVWTGTSWMIQTIDSVGNVGTDTSIALDAFGRAHVSYYDWTNANLKLARQADTSWNISTVDAAGTVGWYSSIALDSLGYDQISYYDDTGGNLKYARWSGLSWDRQIVDSIGIVGYHTSLAVDASNTPHVSYFDKTNGDLKYARGPFYLPSAPLGLKASPRHELVKLNWTPPASDGGFPITNYRVYRGLASGQESLLVTLGNVLVYTDAGLVNYQTYYYRVSAINIRGEGPMSFEVEATPGVYRVAELAGHGAWPEHHHFVISKHGSYQTLYGKMENIGTMEVKAKVVFEIFDDTGALEAIVDSEAAAIPIRGKAVVSGTWAVELGSFTVLGRCWYDSDYDGSFDSVGEKVKEFSFKVVP